MDGNAVSASFVSCMQSTSGWHSGQPLLDPLQAGLQGVDVPGGEPHGRRRYRRRRRPRRHRVGAARCARTAPLGAGGTPAPAGEPVSAASWPCGPVPAWPEPSWPRPSSWPEPSWPRPSSWPEPSWLRSSSSPEPSWLRPSSSPGLLGCGCALLGCGLLAWPGLLGCCLLAAGAFLAAAFFRAGAFLAAAFFFAGAFLAAAFFFAGATRSSSVGCTGSPAEPRSVELPIDPGTTPGMVRSTPRRGVSNAWTTNV